MNDKAHAEINMHLTEAQTPPPPEPSDAEFAKQLFNSREDDTW